MLLGLLQIIHDEGQNMTLDAFSGIRIRIRVTLFAMVKKYRQYQDRHDTAYIRLKLDSKRI
jgi:hypothetical protein